MDDRAYGLLLEEFESPLYRFFYYSHRDHQLAQDQCSETFIRFIGAINKMNKKTDKTIKPFIFGIARNILLQHFRKKDLAVADLSIAEHLPGNSPSALQMLIKQERFHSALSAIDQFQYPQKQIILLRFVEQLKLEHISSVMDVPLSSVKAHLYRGREKLRNILQTENSSDRSQE